MTKLPSRVYVQINLDAIAYNMEQMKANIGDGSSMIAVIKADGYGHGAVPIAKIFDSNQYDYVWGYATATLDEAYVLKQEQIKKPVLVLGCVFSEQYETMLQHGIRATVYTLEMAAEISKAAQEEGKTAYIHIKIDTGMGRLGFSVCEESATVISEISKLPNLCIEGMFTHFSKADETDKTYTRMQHEQFQEMQRMIQERDVEIPYYHCNNSAGIIEFPELKHDLVRAGIALYGLYPSDEVNKTAVHLKPALELISHVTFVKDIVAGTALSYGGTFVAEKKMRVATIPVGYGDGYSRGLSNKGDVLIHGKRARILGRVCMDQFMVDVTEIPEVVFGDKVVLIGSDGGEFIPVEELGRISGRFNYEFVCCLSKRISRIYLQNDEIIGKIDYFS